MQITPLFRIFERCLYLKHAAKINTLHKQNKYLGNYFTQNV
nr:MAG TPA: DNA mismatch repair protein [Caudoviricetes sp.]